MIEWLESEIEDMSGERVYPRDKIKYEMVPLVNDGVLVLNWDPPKGFPPNEEKLWLKFAVLRWFCSDGDHTNVMYSCEFHGDGPSSCLRECRHTYWGDDGYLFYPDGKLIAAGLKELSKYYDELA